MDAVKNALGVGTGSRKVAIFVPVWITACVFLWFGKIDAGMWKEMTVWGYGFLAAGLTAEHFSGGK